MASKTRLFDTCDSGVSRVPPAHDAKAAVKLKGPVANVRKRTCVPLPRVKPPKNSRSGDRLVSAYWTTTRPARLREGAGTAWPSTMRASLRSRRSLSSSGGAGPRSCSNPHSTVAELAVTAPVQSHDGVSPGDNPACDKPKNAAVLLRNCRLASRNGNWGTSARSYRTGRAIPDLRARWAPGLIRSPCGSAIRGVGACDWFRDCRSRVRPRIGARHVPGTSPQQTRS